MATVSRSGVDCSALIFDAVLQYGVMQYPGNVTALALYCIGRGVMFLHHFHKAAFAFKSMLGNCIGIWCRSSPLVLTSAVSHTTEKDAILGAQTYPQYSD